MEVVVLAEEHASGRLWAQHGISFLLKVERGDKVYKVLFDTGTSWTPIEHNLELLNEDLKGLIAIVLSHRHYDHTGGLLGALKSVGKPTPVIAHPDIFSVNFVLPMREIGLPYSREELESAGARFILSRDPVEIVPGVITTGEVPRVDPVEREMTLEAYTVRDGRLSRDPMMDDLSLVVKTSAGGVVLTGCSHAGVLNIVRRAKQLVGEVYAVMGGFHLIGADDNRIRATVRGFRELGVKKVMTGHCTGIKAECAFLREYGEDFDQLAVGKRYLFPD